MRYHINPETLQPGQCRAESDVACPWRTNGHYSSMVEAQEHAEALTEERQCQIDSIHAGPDVIGDIAVPTGEDPEVMERERREREADQEAVDAYFGVKKHRFLSKLF
jgi:hypothetical protein